MDSGCELLLTLDKQFASISEQIPISASSNRPYSSDQTLLD